MSAHNDSNALLITINCFLEVDSKIFSKVFVNNCFPILPS